MCGRSACTVRRGEGPKPIGPSYPYHEIREALLAGVRPCKLRTGQDPGRCLAGRLDITGALHLPLLTKRDPMSREPKVEEVEAVSASLRVPGDRPR